MHPIPAARAHTLAPTDAQARSAAAAGGVAVLVVHADAQLRRKLGQALGAAEFAVVPAESAQAALDLGPQTWAAAVLQAPPGDASGMQQLRRMLRTQSPGLPLVLLFSAQRHGQPRHAEADAEADAILCESAPSAAIAATLQGLVRAHRAEEQLRAQEAAWRARQAQAHNHAHALRNPLNAILMSAQVLARMPLPPAAQRAVDAICRNAQTQAHLIADTLQAHRAPLRDEASVDPPPR